MNFTMLCNCLCILPCCAIVWGFHHVVQLFVYFTILCNCLCVLPYCAIVCVFYHVVQLFVYFNMLCNCLCISPCYVIISEFHNVAQLWSWGVVKVLFLCSWGVVVMLFWCSIVLNFTMLCNSFWISPCCGIFWEFHQIVKLFVNFIILRNCLRISTCYVIEVLLKCCWGVVGILLGYCCGVVEVMLRWCLGDV